MSTPFLDFFLMEKNKMTSVEYVRMICKEKKIPISKLESDLGYGNGYLNPKKLRKVPLEKAPDIAEYLKIDVFTLLDEEDQKRLLATQGGATYRIPVVRRVAAGIPLDSIEEIIDWEELPAYMSKTGTYFGLQIQGDSMEPGIRDGDVVIVREQPDAEDGQIVVALVNGNNGTCKRLKKYDDGTIALISDNASYPPIYFNNAEVDTIPVVIKGIVRELRRKF